MPYFPQLCSGAMAQYPFSKRRVLRTVVNEHFHGGTTKLLDPTWSQIEWALSLSGLNDEEKELLESFFQSVEGRLKEFTFLDPSDNLLMWSESISAAAWVKDPFIQLTGGVSDPESTNRATRIENMGGGVQRVQQIVHGPIWFHYCFSFQARGEAPGDITLFRSATSQVDSRRVACGPRWTRFILSGSFESTEESVTFGIALDPGASVEVYGLQVEAQPWPSPYRSTTTRSGVYRKCRFGHDALLVTTDGPGLHSCSGRLIAAITD